MPPPDFPSPDSRAPGGSNTSQNRSDSHHKEVIPLVIIASFDFMIATALQSIFSKKHLYDIMLFSHVSWLNIYLRLMFLHIGNTAVNLIEI